MDGWRVWRRQLGYNLQRDRFVFGIEADIQGSRIKQIFSRPFRPRKVGTSALTKTSLDWFGTFARQARLFVRQLASLCDGRACLWRSKGFPRPVGLTTPY